MFSTPTAAPLPPGARYAGTPLNEAGQPTHHVILLAHRPVQKLNWQAAKLWAGIVGGELPDRQEQALLFANCKPHLQSGWHWSCQEDEKDASYAWSCGFDYGLQYDDHKSFEGSAVAVRRLPLESFSPFSDTPTEPHNAIHATLESTAPTRDDLAIKAMAEVAWFNGTGFDDCAKLCYDIADATLKARQGGAA